MIRLIIGLSTVLFVWLSQVSVSAAVAALRTVVVRFADAAAYYIATAGFISINRRTRRNEQELTQNVDVAAAAGTCGNQTNSPYIVFVPLYLCIYKYKIKPIIKK